MKRFLIVATLFLGLSVITKGQNVSITPDGANPDPSAMLDIQAIDKGLLIPRLSASQRLAIDSPANGLLVYDVDSVNFFFFNGNVWSKVGSGSVSVSSNQTLTFTNSQLSISNGNSIDLSSLNSDNQQLELIGNSLSITGGNSLDLSSLSSSGNDDQTISLSGAVLTLEDGGSVDLSGLDTDTQLDSTAIANMGFVTSTGGVDTDDQTLTFNNTTGELSISEGNTITLPISTGGDNWGSQSVATDGTTITGDGTSSNPIIVNGDLTDDQAISFNGAILTLENGGAVDLSVIDTDTQLDSTDIVNLGFVAGNHTIQLDSSAIANMGFVTSTGGVDTDDQTLTFNNTTGELSISEGNTITLPISTGGDNWGSQSVVTDGTTITGDGTSSSPITVNGDLTDNQTLSLSGTDLTISGANTIDLSTIDTKLTATEVDAIVSDNGYLTSITEVDGDVTNELQTISLSNDTIYLTNGGSVKLPSGSVDTQLTESEVDAYVANNGFITNANDADADPTNEIQTLQLSNDTIYLSNGGGNIKLPSGSVDTKLTESEVDAFVANNGYLTSFTEVDGDVTNELQGISISNDTIYLTNGGSVKLPSGPVDTQLTESEVDAYVANNGFITNANDADADPTNEIQTLQLSNDTIYLSNGGGNIKLPSGSVDTKLTESEVDAFVANNGYLTSFTEVDGSVTNEIQDLSLSGNTLIITNNTSATAIDLTAVQDGTGTDDQALTLSGTMLSLEDGGSVDLSGIDTDTDTQLTEAEVDAYVSDNGYLTSFTEVDGSVTNEIQDLSLSGTNVLSITGGTTNIDLNFLQDGTGTDDQTLSFNTTSNILSITDGNTVDLSSLSGGTGSSEFITESGIVHNTTAIATDDFVFGATNGEYSGGSSEDSRLFFDKSKSAFRAGYADGDEWDGSNVGVYSLSGGYNNTSSGFASLAFGTGSTSSGDLSMAFGDEANSQGGNSLAFGNNVTAAKNYSVAIGNQVYSDAEYAIVIGNRNTASNDHAIAIGNDIDISGWYSVGIGSDIEVAGGTSFAFGQSIIAPGGFALAFGDGNTRAQGDYSFAFGTNSNGEGEHSFSFGNANYAAGDYTISIGNQNISDGDYSTSIGYQNEASGDYSTAIGYTNVAQGYASFALGQQTTAKGMQSLVFGFDNTTEGDFSVAGGNNTTATGEGSFAFGSDNNSYGYYSTALGVGSFAPSYGEVVIGTYSTFIPGNQTSFSSLDRAFAVGNGTSSSSRSDAMVVMKNGYVGINESDPSTNLEVFTGMFGSTSILTNGEVEATAFNVASDERIKKISGVSNSKEDLKTLSEIEITDYTYKDTLASVNQSFKKVIAQQVNEVFPLAVNTKGKQFVPNIYKASSIASGRIDMKNNLQIGDKVRLIFSTSEEKVEVLEVGDGYFVVNSNNEGAVFVYGQEVNDFHSVDYDAISMLNVSATQELLKRIEVLEKQNENQRTSFSIELNSLNAKVDLLIQSLHMQAAK